MNSTLPSFRTLLAAALAACSLVSLGAHAEGAYVGGALGATHDAAPIDGIDGKTSGVDGKLYAGVQLNPYAAVELGFADLGHASDAVGKETGHGTYIDAVGRAPLTPGVSLLGSVGMDHTRFLTTQGDGAGNGLKLGLGAEFAVAKNLAVRTELERYQVHVFDAKPDVNQFTVGLQAAF